MAAGLLAILAQAGLVLLVVQSRGQKHEPEEDSRRLIIIQLPQVEQKAARAQSGSVRPAPAAAVPALIEPARASPEVVTSEAITLPPGEAPGIEPRIDWYRNTEQSAKAFAEKEASRQVRENPLNSRPQALVLPRGDSGPPPPFTEQRLDNGDLLTRHRVTDTLTIYCTHRQIPLNQHFEALARKGAALCRMPEQTTSRMPVDFSGLEPPPAREREQKP